MSAKVTKSNIIVDSSTYDSGYIKVGSSANVNVRDGGYLTRSGLKYISSDDTSANLYDKPGYALISCYSSSSYLLPYSTTSSGSYTSSINSNYQVIVEKMGDIYYKTIYLYITQQPVALMYFDPNIGYSTSSYGSSFKFTDNIFMLANGSIESSSQPAGPCLPFQYSTSKVGLSNYPSWAAKGVYLYLRGSCQSVRN